MSAERPRFRRDLVPAIHEVDGIRVVDVTDPRRHTSFRFFDYEYSVALAFDGRPLAKVIPWVRLTAGLDLTIEQLSVFAQELEALGFLEAEAVTPASQPQPAIGHLPIPEFVDVPLGDPTPAPVQVEPPTRPARTSDQRLMQAAPIPVAQPAPQRTTSSFPLPATDRPAKARNKVDALRPGLLWTGQRETKRDQPAPEETPPLMTSPPVQTLAPAVTLPLYGQGEEKPDAKPDAMSTLVGFEPHQPLTASEESFASSLDTWVAKFPGPPDSPSPSPSPEPGEFDDERGAAPQVLLQGHTPAVDISAQLAAIQEATAERPIDSVDVFRTEATAWSGAAESGPAEYMFPELTPLAELIAALVDAPEPATQSASEWNQGAEPESFAPEAPAPEIVESTPWSAPVPEETAAAITEETTEESTQETAEETTEETTQPSPDETPAPSEASEVIAASEPAPVVEEAVVAEFAAPVAEEAAVAELAPVAEEAAVAELAPVVEEAAIAELAAPVVAEAAIAEISPVVEESAIDAAIDAATDQKIDAEFGESPGTETQAEPPAEARSADPLAEPGAVPVEDRLGDLDFDDSADDIRETAAAPSVPAAAVPVVEETRAEAVSAALPIEDRFANLDFEESGPVLLSDVPAAATEPPSTPESASEPPDEPPKFQDEFEDDFVASPPAPSEVELPSSPFETPEGAPDTAAKEDAADEWSAHTAPTVVGGAFLPVVPAAPAVEPEVALAEPASIEPEAAPAEPAAIEPEVLPAESAAIVAESDQSPSEAASTEIAAHTAVPDGAVDFPAPEPVTPNSAADFTSIEQAALSAAETSSIAADDFATSELQPSETSQEFAAQSHQAVNQDVNQDAEQELSQNLGDPDVESRPDGVSDFPDEGPVHDGPVAEADEASASVPTEIVAIREGEATIPEPLAIDAANEANEFFAAAESPAQLPAPFDDVVPPFAAAASEADAFASPAEASPPSEILDARDAEETVPRPLPPPESIEAAYDAAPVTEPVTEPVTDPTTAMAPTETTEEAPAPVPVLVEVPLNASTLTLPFGRVSETTVSAYERPTPARQAIVPDEGDLATSEAPLTASPAHAAAATPAWEAASLPSQEGMETLSGFPSTTPTTSRSCDDVRSKELLAFLEGATQERAPAAPVVADPSAVLEIRRSAHRPVYRPTPTPLRAPYHTPGVALRVPAGRRWALLGYALLGVTCAVALGVLGLPWVFASRPPEGIKVRTFVPEAGTVYRWFEASAPLQRAELQTLDFPAAGKVTRVVAPGTVVATGDVLATVDASRSLQAELVRLQERQNVYRQQADQARAEGDVEATRQAEAKVEEKSGLIRQTTAAISHLAVVAQEPGQVEEVAASVGQTVQPGVPAVRVRPAGWRARFELPRAQAAQARHVGFCRLEVEGRLLDCVLQADSSDDLHVNAELDGIDPQLTGKPARLARVRYESVFVLPPSAVSRVGNVDRVWVASSNNRVESRSVLVADQSAGGAIVLQGLDSGEAVIIDPPATLHSAALIQPSRITSP